MCNRRKPLPRPSRLLEHGKEQRLWSPLRVGSLKDMATLAGTVVMERCRYCRDVVPNREETENKYSNHPRLPLTRLLTAPHWLNPGRNQSEASPKQGSPGFEPQERKAESSSPEGVGREEQGHMLPVLTQIWRIVPFWENFLGHALAHRTRWQLFHCRALSLIHLTRKRHENKPELEKHWKG